MVAVGCSPCAVVHVEAYVVNALCLAVLAVDIELLPCVQSDDDDECQAYGQSEHVHSRVCLIPREEREIAFKVKVAHILCCYYVSFFVRLAALFCAVCRIWFVDL